VVNEDGRITILPGATIKRDNLHIVNFLHSDSLIEFLNVFEK